MVRPTERPGIMALIALFVALLVLIPAVDASACAVERDPGHAAALLIDDIGDEPAEPGDHAICNHGHCHHAGVTALATVDSETTLSFSDAGVMILPSLPMLSRAPSGLERPPRA